MRTFHAVVLDRLRETAADFETEPYEVGWANEAMFFVRIHEGSAAARMSSAVQVSTDGINWADEGSTIESAGEGVNFVRVRQFGGWLRLHNVVRPGAAPMVVTVHLVLKG